MSKHLLLSADQCQAEARVVAWLSKDKNMIKAAESGQFHIQNAINMYELDLSTKEKIQTYKKTEQYVLVKSCGHGSNYGMSAYEFSRITNISKQKAENVLTLYHNTYTGIRKTFHQYIEDEIKKKRMLFNPFGRRYVFFGYLDETTYKTGYSFIPQSTITDINKQALARLYKKWNCLLDTHDGILFSVPENQIEQASKEIVSAYASIKFKIWNIEHTIPVEIKVGKNWKDMTEIEIDKKEN